VIAQNVAFWIIAGVMGVSAIGVVRSRNVVHAALLLVAVLAGAAAQYILLAAEFVAWAQVLIYIGAVVVLFLFGIMLTRAPMGTETNLDNDQRWPAAIVSVALLALLVVLLLDAFGGDMITLDDNLLATGRTANVGSSLFRDYAVPFETISMLILAALVGAVALARRD
jgi:NADH-quinone oxidoreductase subunit J